MEIAPLSPDNSVWVVKPEFLTLDIRKKIGLMLIPVSLSLMGIFSLLNIPVQYNSPVLILALNTVFICFISLAIAFLTSRVFAKSGSVSVFLIGSGSLIFGLGLISASWFHVFTGDLNIFLTIGNTSACVGSVFIFIGALISMYGPLLWSGGERIRVVTGVYSAILFFVSLFSLGAMQGMVPPFFIEGIGPTVIRQVILENTIIFVALSSLLCMFTYFRRQSDFFFWYSVSFALISIGLLASFPHLPVGSPVVWVGRCILYLGFVCALYAVFVAQWAVTTKGLLLEAVIGNFFFDTEQSYKMLMETVTDAIVIFDENYQVILWNSAAERMFGYTRDEAVGSSFPELAIDDPSIMVLKTEGQDVKSGGQDNGISKTIEIMGKRKDGARFPVELTFSYRRKKGRMIQTGILRDLTERRRLEAELLAVNQVLETKVKERTEEISHTLETRSLTDNEGNDIGMLAGMMDITERRRGEDEIKLQNIILTTQQETSLDGILTVDDQGKIISCNQRFINLWGISEEVVASRSGEHAFKTVSGKVENSDEFLAMVKHLHEHTEEENRKVITLVDGSILDRFSAPMFGKDGRYYGRVWYFRDITTQKLAEREILTLNQDLERRVHERTHDLRQLNSELISTNEELAITEEELQVQIDVVNEAYTSLEKSEERSRRLYESDLIGIAFADQEKIRDSNDTFLAMIGYSKEDLEQGSVTWKKITPPEYADADLKGLEELKTRGSCTPYEKEYSGKDGSRVPVMFGAALLEKNPLTWVCFIEDITERKRTEEKLLKISEEYQLARDYAQSIVDTVREPLVVLNGRFEVISASRSFYATFEVTPDATLGKVLYELGNNQWDIPRLHELLETVLPESTSFDNFDIEHEFPGIGHRNMLLNARRILSETGNTELILLVIEDITERKQIEEKLLMISVAARLARDYAESIVDTVREPLVVLNGSFEVISASRSFYATFEVTPEATLGKVLYELGNNQWDIPRLHELLETVLPESTSFDNFDIEHEFPGIGHRNMLLNARRILSETGNTELILLVIEDVTERKKLTAQIEASLAEKETLLREIHHRVKNNLQTIVSLLNLQIRRIEDPVTIDALKESQSRVRSMALVHEHLYQGKDLSHIDLARYIKALGTAIFQSFEAGRRGIKFDVSIKNIYVDINVAVPLGLISTELVTNSLKYAFPGDDDAIISFAGTQDSHTLNFIVADNGIGIPEEITLDNQNSMGLRLVSTLTDQLNGTVVIDRTEGTKFVFVIPTSKKHEENELYKE